MTLYLGKTGNAREFIKKVRFGKDVADIKEITNTKAISYLMTLTQAM